MRFLGDISGECFLIHLIIVRGLQKLTTQKIVVAFVGLLFTVIVALAWRRLETKWSMVNGCFR